jgi:hypothetical protein
MTIKSWNYKGSTPSLGQISGKLGQVGSTEAAGNDIGGR